MIHKNELFKTDYSMDEITRKFTQISLLVTTDPNLKAVYTRALSERCFEMIASSVEEVLKIR